MMHGPEYDLYPLGHDSHNSLDLVGFDCGLGCDLYTNRFGQSFTKKPSPYSLSICPKLEEHNENSYTHTHKLRYYA